MSFPYTSNTHIVNDTSSKDKLSGWKRAIKMYISKETPKEVIPVPARHHTNSSSRFLSFLHGNLTPNAPTGYKNAQRVQIGPPIGLHQEGGNNDANNAFPSTAFAPSRIADILPTRMSQRPRTFIPPTASSYHHVRSLSTPELPTICPTFGRRHPDRDPTTSHRRAESGPAALQRPNKIVKTVRWPDGLRDTEVALHKRQTQADAQHVQPNQPSGQEHARRSHDRHRSANGIVNSPAHGRDESRRYHHRQAHFSPQRSPPHSHSREDTTTPQCRKTVPHHVMPPPIVMLERFASTSSPHRDTRRREAKVTAAALKADMARTDRELRAACARLEESLEDTQRCKGRHPYGIVPY